LRIIWERNVVSKPPREATLAAKHATRPEAKLPSGSKSR